MIDRTGLCEAGGARAVDGRAISARDVADWVQQVQQLDRKADDAERIDLIRALEELSCAAAAAQAVLTVDFEDSQRARAAERGVPQARQGRGIAEQVALARRESPHRA